VTFDDSPGSSFVVQDGAKARRDDGSIRHEGLHHGFMSTDIHNRRWYDGGGAWADHSCYLPERQTQNAGLIQAGYIGQR